MEIIRLPRLYNTQTRLDERNRNISGVFRAQERRSFWNSVGRTLVAINFR